MIVPCFILELNLHNVSTEITPYVAKIIEELGSKTNLPPKIANNRGAFTAEFSDGQIFKFSNVHNALFTKRAILRVGMLLRDSAVQDQY